MAFGCYVFGTLGNEANIVIQYYLVPCRLSVTPKYMTLNDLDGLFGVNSVFAPLILGRDSSFYRYKVCADIRSGSLERRR